MSDDGSASQRFVQTLPPGARVISVAELLREAKTLDIMLWCGEGFFPFLVHALGNSRFSHVGLCYRPHDGEGTPVYHWESTQSVDPPCLLRGGEPRFKTGCKLTDLAEKLKGYKGRFVALRRLHVRARDASPEALAEARAAFDLAKQRMYSFMQDNADKLYETDPVELFLSQRQGNSRPAPDEYFCCELSDDTLRGSGVSEARLTGYRPANNTSLTHFESLGGSDPEVLRTLPSSSSPPSSVVYTSLPSDTLREVELPPAPLPVRGGDNRQLVTLEPNPLGIRWPFYYEEELYAIL